MSKALLQRVITNGVDDNLNDFFLSVSNLYTEKDDDLADYDDERLANFKGIGEINFEDGQKLVVVTADTTRDLTERSGKRDQYEKAKRILKFYTRYDAGIFVFSDATGNFRLSLVYGTPDATRTVWSNFRRFTYFVTREQTNNTLLGRIGGCGFSSLDTIKDAFSVEKVNKEFYNHITRFFYRLTGYQCTREMTLPSVSDDDKKTYQEFAVRLIGRAIFCWFLKHKKSANGISLIPDSILSSEAVKPNSRYYHSTLEKLFFEVLNTPQKQRHKNILPVAERIPFLNGGLFEPHKDDSYYGQPLYSLVIQDEWFGQFFAMLEQYNFTIDENSTVDADVSVDPEMLGRIFENLLAEVNPHTGEAARKATGSYYTPRTIVDYMVDQTLKQYLITKTRIDEDKIIALLSYEASEVILNKNESVSIVTALDEIKIIDPACGSGAFPMGILHKMLLVLNRVDPDMRIWVDKRLESIADNIFKEEIKNRLERDNLEYARKLVIIRNSIFGVDIQQIAVEISKLRFFLSLIVDEKIDDDAENRGIKSLPNLEFKFVEANSLVGLPKLGPDREALIDFEDKESIAALARIRDNYFTSYGKEKLRTQREFIELQKKMFQFYLQNMNQEQRNLVGTVKNAKPTGKTVTQMLSEWEPFSNKQSEWFDPTWMFGEDDFHVVIANPPYLGEKGHKEIFSLVKQGTLQEYYLGKMDLFYFYFHLALNLGTANAQIAFITTNYYPTAFGATKLRKDFEERTTVRKLINFNELRIFEAAQGQHNMLTFLSKGCDHDVHAETCVTARTGIATPQILQTILGWQDTATDYYQVSQNDLYEGEECYIRLTGTAESEGDPMQGVLNKLKTQGQELIQFCNVNQGIVTGADKVSRKHIEKYHLNAEIGDGIFVLSDSEIEVLNLGKKEQEILKPWFKNSDIAQYNASKSTNEWLIDLNYTARLDIDKYPSIKTHLSKFELLLKDRPTPGTLMSAFSKGMWWVLTTSRRQDFNGPKIVVPQRSPRNTFGYNEIPWYAASDVFFITGKDNSVSLEYILALLNSTLYYLWLYHRGKRKGETLELIVKPLSEIPIKKITKPDQKPFISIVDKILAITQDEDYISNSAKQAEVRVLESEIDKLVYRLYDLSEREISAVEGRLVKDSEAGITNAPEITPTEEVEIDDQEENIEEAARVEIILTKDKETPGTWRYKEQKEDHPLTIYLTKEQVKALGNPESIKITVTAA